MADGGQVFLAAFDDAAGKSADGGVLARVGPAKAEAQLHIAPLRRAAIFDGRSLDESQHIAGVRALGKRAAGDPHEHGNDLRAQVGGGHLLAGDLVDAQQIISGGVHGR